jgi:hypothetical protein
MFRDLVLLQIVEAEFGVVFLPIVKYMIGRPNSTLTEITRGKKLKFKIC